MKTIHLPSGEKCGNQSRYFGSLVICWGLAPSEALARQICIAPERVELK
jgi:hypothetical protein